VKGALHQIQARYDAAEDRILLRIKTSDKAELRFWLTRRYLSHLWPPLYTMMDATLSSQALGASADSGVASDPSSRAALRSFAHDAAVANADFQSRYEEESHELPLGEQPVLLTRIGRKRLEDGTFLLSMHPPKGLGIDLKLSSHLLHGLVKLLSDAARKAEWNLDFGVEVEANTPPSSRLLN